VASGVGCPPRRGFDLVAGVGTGHGTTGDGDDLDGRQRKEDAHVSIVGRVHH
jgi:hypothetical protein